MLVYDKFGKYQRDDNTHTWYMYSYHLYICICAYKWAYLFVFLAPGRLGSLNTKIVFQILFQDFFPKLLLPQFQIIRHPTNLRDKAISNLTKIIERI